HWRFRWLTRSWTRRDLGTPGSARCHRPPRTLAAQPPDAARRAGCDPRPAGPGSVPRGRAEPRSTAPRKAAARRSSAGLGPERGVGDGLDRPFALGLVAIRFDRECGLPRDAFPRKTLALRTAARDPLAIAPAPSSPASAATATTTSRFALPGSLALGQRLAFR